MFHVATARFTCCGRARVNKLKHEDVEISGLYWHFVDLVWMFVFPLIYIMSVDVGITGL
jgi:cytochrome c oxidase subunit 3